VEPAGSGQELSAMADEATVAPDGTGSQAWKRQRLIELGYGVAMGCG
jgi:hypothetical protein